jgi:uncharacterized delta-60 repeat protein
MLAATASLIGTDTSTQGNWTGVYGSNGYSIVGGSTTLPSYGTFSVTGNQFYEWQGPGTYGNPAPTDPRDPQVRAGDTNRVAAADVSDSSLSYNVAITDGNVHQVAFYLFDWDSRGRAETVTVSDPTTGAVLATNDVTKFSGGEYLVYNISGSVTVNVSNDAGSLNAVVSGVFFDPGPGTVGPVSTAPGQATLLSTDTTTQGNWSGVYGADGYNVIGGDTSVPSYATFALSGGQFYDWQFYDWQLAGNWQQPAPTDVRDPQVAPGDSNRVAATEFDQNNITFDLSLNDRQTHRIAFYLLDWDSQGRSETVTVSDATSGQVLSTTDVTSFSQGKYLVYNLSGHVKVTISNDAGSANAVVSGVFFDPVPNTTAGATRLASVAAGQSYTVSLGATQIAGQTINSWDVNWGDGTPDDTASAGGSVVHSYAYPGTYTVSASATLADGTTVNVPANIDGSFGTGGTATTDFGGNDTAAAMAVQSDGSLIAVGSSNGSFALTHYNANGSIDTDFGSSGTVVTPAANGPATAVAIGANGEIYVAGYVWDSTAGHDDLALAAYGPNGALDTTFGVNGIATMSFAGANAYGAGVGVQSGGRIVVAGYTSQGTAVLVGFNPDGTVDTGFATNGIVTAPSSLSSASALAVQQDDSLVLAGSGSGGPAMLRFAAAGTLDTSFDNAGSVSLPASVGLAPDLAIDYSGTQSGNANWGDIVAAGNAVVRYTAAGVLDTSFGYGGTAQSLGTPFTAAAVAITGDGQVVIAGALNGAFAAAKYASNGLVQYAFGLNGQLAMAIGSSTGADATAIAVGPDGTIALAGYAWNGTSNDFAVASLLPSDAATVNTPVPTLSANAVSDAEIDLNWGSVYSGASGVEVLRSTDGTTYTPIASLGASDTSYHDTTVADSSSYDYELLVEGSCGTPAVPSAYTDPITASTAPPVTNLTGTAASSSEIDLSWANNDPTATAFEVDRSPDAENWQAVATTPDAATLNYRDIGIPEGGPYYYRVRPVRPPGPGNPSFPIVASTPIAQPTSPSAPTTYWVAPSGAGFQFTQSAPGSLTDVVRYLDTAPRPVGGAAIVYLEPDSGGNDKFVLNQTLKIDGGDANAPGGDSNTTFEPAPGSGTPVVTSGVEITGWNFDHNVPAKNGNPAFGVYSAPVDSSKFHVTTQFRDLYLNGQRVLRARTPAAGSNYEYIDAIATGVSNGNYTLSIDIPKADAPDYVDYRTGASMSFPDYVAQQYNSGTNAVEIAVVSGYNISHLRIAKVDSSKTNPNDYTLGIATSDANGFRLDLAAGCECLRKKWGRWDAAVFPRERSPIPKSWRILRGHSCRNCLLRCPQFRRRGDARRK